MRSIVTRRLLWTLAVVGSYAIGCQAVGYSVATPVQTTDPVVWPSTAWMSEKWTGDNRPFVKARIELETKVHAHQLTPKIVAGYEAKFAKDDQDALGLYCWAYAAFLTGYPHGVDHPGEAQFMALAHDPRSYDFDRCRFLVSANPHVPLRFKELGIRLYRQDRQDTNVMWYVADMLQYSKDLADRALALRLAERLTEMRPKDPDSWGLLGNGYYIWWYNGNYDRSDRDKALAAFKKCMTLAKPTDPRLAQLKDMMSDLKAGSFQYHGPPIVHPAK